MFSSHSNCTGTKLKSNSMSSPPITGNSDGTSNLNFVPSFNFEEDIPASSPTTEIGFGAFLLTNS